MQDDENVRAYVQRVTEVVTRIRNSRGTYTEEEVIAKILRSLTPVYNEKVQVVEEVIPITLNFNKEMLIAKLTTFETIELQEALPKVETTFKATVHKDFIQPCEHQQRQQTCRAWRIC